MYVLLINYMNQFLSYCTSQTHNTHVIAVVGIDTISYDRLLQVCQELVNIYIVSDFPERTHCQSILPASVS